MDHVIDAALCVVGKDTIEDLFKFIEKRQKLANEKGSYSDWLMYSRIILELSLAIATYASCSNKEK